MRFRQYVQQLNENEINLIGKTINRHKITSIIPYWAGPLDCAQENLTSLKGCPTEVDGDMWCFDNHLTSLKCSPRTIKGSFDCSKNQLKTFEGAPDFIGKRLLVADNKFTNLKNIHKHLKYVGGHIDLSSNEITSHVLGLLLIQGVTWIHLDNVEVSNILRKYIGDGRQGVMDAQNELIEAGYEEYAQL